LNICCDKGSETGTLKITALQRFSKMKHVCVATLVAITFITPSRAVWHEKNPADAVRSFYNWYVHEVQSGARPLEKERELMRKFVTDRLLNRIDKMPNGPGGLERDFSSTPRRLIRNGERILPLVTVISGKQCRS
jgi:hypothetical protein